MKDQGSFRASPSIPSESVINTIAKEQADWLVDAFATATQDRRFLRGDPKEDEGLTEVLSLNAEKAIQIAIVRANANALQLLRQTLADLDRRSAGATTANRIDAFLPEARLADGRVSGNVRLARGVLGRRRGRCLREGHERASRLRAAVWLPGRRLCRQMVRWTV